jgi:aspartate racemase
MDSVSLADWMRSFDAGDYRGVGRVMLDSLRLLSAAGADFAVCPDNSAHLAWEHIEADSPIPLLHIARVVAREAQQRGFERVGVLGTRFTMDGPLYRDALSAVGIDTLIPNPDEREAIDRIIFGELLDGVFTDASRRTYQDVISRLAGEGCDAVALACTEIPLLIGPDDSVIPTLDSTRLLAKAALREAETDSDRGSRIDTGCVGDHRRSSRPRATR